jgi:hypothetical protein
MQRIDATELKVSCILKIDEEVGIFKLKLISLFNVD